MNFSEIVGLEMENGRKKRKGRIEAMGHAWDELATSGSATSPFTSVSSTKIIRARRPIFFSSQNFAMLAEDQVCIPKSNIRPF